MTITRPDLPCARCKEAAREHLSYCRECIRKGDRARYARIYKRERAWGGYGNPCKNGHPFNEDDFYERKPGWWRCKKCMKTYAERYRNKVKVSRREGFNNLPEGWYESRLVEQEGKCAICFTPVDDLTKGLAIDHDHAHCSGRFSCGRCVRGLLCSECNMGLGWFGDSIFRLEKAKEYLERWNGQST